MCIELIKSQIFEYLRPSDISSLCISIGHRLDNYYKDRYMKPILEIFSDPGYAIGRPMLSDEGIILVGKDLKYITDYRKTAENLFIYIIGRPEEAIGKQSYISNNDEVVRYLYENNIRGTINLSKYAIRSNQNTHFTYSNNRISGLLSLGSNTHYYNAPIWLQSLGHELDRTIELWKNNALEGRTYTCSIDCCMFINGICTVNTISLELTSYIEDLAEGLYSILRVTKVTPETVLTRIFLHAFSIELLR